MSTLREAVKRARAAGWPFVGVVTPLSGLVAEAYAQRRQIEEAECRLRRVCAVVDADPEPFLKAAGGNPHTLEAMYRRIARDGSAGVSALASELADA